MTRAAILSSIALAAGFCEDLPWHEEELPDPGCAERQAFHPDADGDGAGDDAVTYLGCEAPAGYVAAGGDCDDADPAATACPDTGARDDTGDTGAE